MAGAGSYEICRGKTPPAPVKINRKAQKNAVYGIIFHIQRSITECKQVHQNALYVKSNKLYNKAIKRYNNTCNALNIQLCMEVSSPYARGKVFPHFTSALHFLFVPYNPYYTAFYG